jgi:3-oxoacyl-[acyl-carrier protein] reductase
MARRITYESAPTPPVNFRGQVAIVTGAGSPEGIGFAIAQRLHQAGLHVTITSTTDRIHLRAKELDASDDRIDVLVNNAGMAQTGHAIEDTTLQESAFSDWKRQIEITLHTAYLMTRAVLPTMRERKYGRIVNVSSVTGPRVSFPGLAAYSAAKAGMEGMMRAVALETAAHGITINSVEPGWNAGRSRGRGSVSCLTRCVVHHWADAGCRRRQHHPGGQRTVRT